MTSKLLEVISLQTYFFTRRGVVKAVDGVSFSLDGGETLGIVGESGCGKTVTMLSIMRLVPQPAGRTVGGQILFEGEDLLHKSEEEMEHCRGSKIGLIMQNPLSSLNPVFTIFDQVANPIRVHQHLSRQKLSGKVLDILRRVDIPTPEVRMREYPHQMSGGMRQRIVGGAAISCQPRLLIADEPTTALDVTIQARYLELLKRIQAQEGIALLFVTHDLGIVAQVCDRVAVMYAGRIVESAEVRQLFSAPIHPYTVGLMESVPKIEVRREQLYSIEGQPPDLANPPAGCRFAPRCVHRKEVCEWEYPPEIRIGDSHLVSCWLAQRKND